MGLLYFVGYLTSKLLDFEIILGAKRYENKIVF